MRGSIALSLSLFFVVVNFICQIAYERQAAWE